MFLSTISLVRGGGTVALVRDLAVEDYATLERTSYVERPLSALDAKRWRSALAGVAHAHGVRIASGYLNGLVWAMVNAESLDPGPLDPGRALRP